MNKIALITGVTGQDGSYLAEILLKKGYAVHGVIRSSSSFNTGKIDYIINNKLYKDTFFLHHGDVTDSSNIHKLLYQAPPNEIYNKGISHINVGSGEGLSVHELALMIKKVIGFEGEIEFNDSKLDGTPRKLLDTLIMNKKGWRPKIKLKKGIEDLYSYFKIYV